MAGAGELVKAGIARLGVAVGTKAGTLTQGTPATESAFTGLVVTERSRLPRPGLTDAEEITALLADDGIDVTPKADARVVFEGESETWHVAQADPIAPGGEAVAWELVLRTDTGRDE